MSNVLSLFLFPGRERYSLTFPLIHLYIYIYIYREPLNALLCLNENLLATGDDQGVIKIWDDRKKQQDPVMVYTEHEDFIADMTYRADKKTLIAAG